MSAGIDLFGYGWIHLLSEIVEESISRQSNRSLLDVVGFTYSLQ